MKISEKLIRATASCDLSTVLRTLDEIDETNKGCLYEIGNAGFTCVSSIAGSNRANLNEYHYYASSRILQEILYKSESIGSSEEHLGLVTSKTNAGFTPLHIAVRQGSYHLANILMYATTAAFDQQVAGRLRHYIEEPNNIGYTLYTTYKKNVDPENRNCRPDSVLAQQIFGENYNHHPQYLAELSSYLRTDNTNSYDTFYV